MGENMQYAVLFLYAILMVGIAIYSRKRVKTTNEFYLGARKVGAWMSAFAYGTTYFSAVIFIGYAGKIGWQFGLSGVWVGLGNALLGSLLAWLVLAKPTRRMTHRLGASTMPEFFEKRYGSRKLKIVAAVIIFIFLVPYSASVYQGLGYLFESTLGISYGWCMVIMATLTAIYVVMGGYLATVLTDFIQGIIMLMGIVVVILVVAANPMVGGFGEGFARLADMDPLLVGPIGPGGIVNLLSLVLLTSLGTWGLPQMIHKFYAIRDEKAIKRGTVISTVFALIVSGGAYFLGVFGRLFQGVWTADAATGWPIDAATGLANPDLIMPNVLMTALPTILIGIVLVLVLSASMSTLSSMVLVSSSAIAMDLIKGIFCPNMKDKHVKLLMQVMCLGFIAVSLFIALNRQAAIIMLMSFSWGTISGSFLAPFLYGLYWKKTTRSGAWAGVITGVSVSVICALATGFSAANAPMIGVIAMLSSGVAVPLVSVLTKKLPQELVEHAFTKEDAAVTADGANS